MHQPPVPPIPVDFAEIVYREMYWQLYQELIPEMPRKLIKAPITTGGRLYTYHCDDATVQVGDKVSITTPHGAMLEVEVQEVEDDHPLPFTTKPCFKV